MRWTKVTGWAAAAVLTAGTAWAGELEGPTALTVGDQKIDVSVGHAAPFVHDWDGDGKNDLLVGQMGNGHLRIYKNVGSNQAPTFDSFELFKAGEAEGTVPTG